MYFILIWFMNLGLFPQISKTEKKERKKNKRSQQYGSQCIQLYTPPYLVGAEEEPSSLPQTL